VCLSLNACLLPCLAAVLLVCRLQQRFEHQLGVGDMTLRNFALLTRADVCSCSLALFLSPTPFTRDGVMFGADYDDVRRRKSQRANEKEGIRIAKALVCFVGLSQAMCWWVQSAPGEKRDVAELKVWDDLKVWGFARTLATVYALCLQNLLTKIHLSLAARYVLVEESVSTDPNHKRLCDHINRQYFSVLSQHTHTKGLKRLCQHLEKAITQVLAK
jgi:hypothetical protein